MRLAGMRPLPPIRRRPTIDMRGKRVLVTGASSGIGESAAKKFAALGATVIVVARREHLLNALVEQIATAGGDAVSIPTDLADLAAVDALVETVGQVDILVNNAARSIRRPVAESLDRWHDFERIMAINFYGQLRLIRGLAPGMIARGDGHIINVSSWRVLPEASPLFSVYIASKAALSAMSRIMETEWEPLGVHSTTLYYPLVATPMIAPTRAYDGLPALTSDEAAEWMITAARTRPVRIAPRMAMAYRALDIVTPGVVNGIMQRQASKLGT
jgi:NAD(P)-dependent dehydrogenase (short-subunit alcohol dehydrogenase family)